METLTHEQLEHLRRFPRKDPKVLASDLKVDVKRVRHALSELRDTSDPFDRRLRWLGPLALVLIGVLAYANNLGCGWHFDDNHSIVKNAAVKFPSVSAIFHYNFYRQVIYWSFALSYSLWELNPRGWHLENNAIHIANGLLVYSFLLLTFRAMGKSAPRLRRLVALFSGALFVAHPLATQGVTYIVQRTESLCTTLSLGALALFALARVGRIEGRLSGERPWLVTLPFASAIVIALGFALFSVTALDVVLLGTGAVLSCLILFGGLAYLHATRATDPRETLLFLGSAFLTVIAMATKEIAGVVPLIALLWEALFAKGAGCPETFPWSPTTRVPAALRPLAFGLPWLALIAGLVPLAVRVGLASKFLGEVEPGYEPGGARNTAEYALTELNVIATYARLFVLPYGQSIDWDYPVATSLFTGPTLVSLGVLLAAVGSAVAAVKKAPLYTFAVAVALLVLAPTSSFFLLPDVIFEHRTYFALLGPALITALFLGKLAGCVAGRDTRKASLVYGAVALPVVLVFAYVTFERNKAWATDETLWKDAIAKTSVRQPDGSLSPRKPRPFVNLGLYYQDTEESRVVLDDGTVLEGELRENGGRAVVIPRLGVPPRPPVEVARDRIRERSTIGGNQLAAEAYRNALQIDGKYYKARNNLAIAEVEMGIRQYEDARGALAMARQAPDPASQEKIFQAARTLFDRARVHFDTCERLLKEMLQSVETKKDRVKRDVYAHFNLASLYANFLERYEDAEKELRIAIELGETEPRVHALLGQVIFYQAAEMTDPVKVQARLKESERSFFDYLRNPSDPNATDMVRNRLRIVGDLIRAGGLVPSEQRAPRYYAR